MSTIEVRFIFPNHDGVNVFLTASKKMRGLQLKDHLIENWPSALEPCNDTDRIRLICMGIGIIKDAAELGSKFPIFADHPTPVNVSIRPVTASDVLRKGIAVPSKQKSETSSHSSPRDDVLQDRLIDCNEVDDADVPTERSSSSGSCNCCIIV